MKSFVVIFTLVGAAALAACGSNAAPTAPANQSAAPTVSSASAPSGTVLPYAADAAGAKAAAQRADMYSALPPMTIDPTKNYRAIINTSKGDVIVDLFPKDAPQHVNSFVYLANQGFYDGLTFHRYVPGFVIQGGDPTGTGTGGPGYTIPPEIKRPHPKGALAMARRNGPAETTPSSGSQFYITLDATPNLDGGYTVFGQTTPETMSVVEELRQGDLINKITIEEQ